MQDFTQASIEALAVHRVGNKGRGEDLYLSYSLTPLENEGLRDILLQYFFGSFGGDEMFRFIHESDLELNPVYHYCKFIFENPENLLDNSQNLARQLFESSDHPKVKSGELYVAYFRDCVLEDEITDAIGLFKCEHQDFFLKLREEGEGIAIDFDEGIDIKDLDKGCLIFNTFGEEGYRCLLVDSSGKMNNEARFWKDDFLKLDRVQDNGYRTATYLELCKNYAEESFVPEAREEKAKFLKESIDYFSKNERFDFNEFTESVIEQDEKREDFRSYRAAHAIDLTEEEDDGFAIVKSAVKKQKSKFKDLIRLDNNVEIKINGGGNLIRKGFDEESGMHFYQIFFKEEA